MGIFFRLQISIVNGSVKESSVEKKYNSNIDSSGDNENNEANRKAPADDETQAADTELDNIPLEEPLVENEDSKNRLKPEDEKESANESLPSNDENGDENGAFSSREQSNERENIEQIKENLSEALIESEKAVSAE